MKSKKASVSHRERLIEELKRDTALAAEYLNVATEETLTTNQGRIEKLIRLNHGPFPVAAVSRRLGSSRSPACGTFAREIAGSGLPVASHGPVPTRCNAPAGGAAGEPQAARCTTRCQGLRDR